MIITTGAVSNYFTKVEMVVTTEEAVEIMIVEMIGVEEMTETMMIMGVGAMDVVEGESLELIS